MIKFKKQKLLYWDSVRRLCPELDNIIELMNDMEYNLLGKNTLISDCLKVRIEQTIFYVERCKKELYITFNALR